MNVERFETPHVINNDSKYAEYLRSVRKPLFDDWGNCERNVDAMLEKFPELRKVRGLVLPAVEADKGWPHWWLEAEDGSIVDPTVAPALILFYEPWDESQKEPIGKCPNCGDYCYEDKWMPLCTEKCQKKYMAYLNSQY